MALNDLGGLALAQGHLDRCWSLLQQSLEMASVDQNHLLLSRVLKNLGGLLQAEGRVEEAQQHLLRALQGAVTAQTTQLALEIIFEMARLRLKMGHEVEAAPLFAVVAAHPAAVHAVRRRAAAAAAHPAAEPLPHLDELVAQLLSHTAVPV